MDKKEKSKKAWEAITAILIHEKVVDFETLSDHLKIAPKPYVIAVQFILLGAGFATPDLDPDGNYGKESQRSLDDLYVTKEGYV